jgi:hypothetical protein
MGVVRMCYLPGGGGSADPGPCAGDACGGSCWFAVLFGLSTVPSSAFMWSKGLAAKNLKAPRPMFAALSREKSWKHTQICQVTADLALETGPFAADSSQPLQAVKVANRRDALDSSRLYRYWSALRRLARIVESRSRGFRGVSKSAKAHEKLEKATRYCAWWWSG